MRAARRLICMLAAAASLWGTWDTFRAARAAGCSGALLRARRRRRRQRRFQCTVYTFSHCSRQLTLSRRRNCRASGRRRQQQRRAQPPLGLRKLATGKLGRRSRRTTSDGKTGGRTISSSPASVCRAQIDRSINQYCHAVAGCSPLNADAGDDDDDKPRPVGQVSRGGACRGAGASGISLA